MELIGYKISSALSENQRFAIVFLHENNEIEVDVTSEISVTPNNHYTDGNNVYSLSVKGMVNVATKKLEKVDESTLIPLRHVKLIELMNDEKIISKAKKIAGVNDNN